VVEGIIYKTVTFKVCNDTNVSDSVYCHVSGVCVANKMGFGFDDGIYWTFT
jgi:hypothetical protein